MRTKSFFNALIRSRYFWLLPIPTWGLLIGASLAWNLANLDFYARDIAYERGKSLFEMVQSTKLNPNVMLSEVPGFSMNHQGDTSFRVVSNRPENPANQANGWESQALSEFSQASDELFEKFDSSAGTVFRYIKPVFMKPGCAACHRKLGYKVGDLRGGISITISAKPILASLHKTKTGLVLVHLISLLVVTLTSMVFLYRLRSQWQLVYDTRDQLEKSERFLTSITDSMGEGCLVLDSAGQISFSNPEAERLLGWQRNALAGKSLYTIIRSNTESGSHTQSNSPILRTLKDGRTRKINEDLFIHHDGHDIPVEYTVSAKFEQGSIDAVVVNFDDISQRKRVESQVTNLAKIIDDSLNEIYVFDAISMRFIWANRGALVNLGYNDEELLAMTPQDLGVKFENSLLEQLRSRTKEKVQLEAIQKRKDGSSYPVEINLQLATYQQQLAFIAIVSNITERKSSEDERRQLERQLNQIHKMEAVGQLASGIAHEINTPIQYIGDNLRFLRDAQRDYQRVHASYQALVDEARNHDALSAIVQQVEKDQQESDIAYLDEETPVAIEQSIYGTQQVSRIVQAMKEFAHPGVKQKSATDLNKTISNAVEVCKNEWKYSANVELSLDPELPLVECQGGDISQVILNLVINAAHAIEAAGRGEKGLISISSSHTQDTVEIRIKDSGTGIPEAIREQIFNPFFTTKDVGKGTGQGLAIAQDIIAVKHRGKLRFETESGLGTTFIIQLPTEPN